jgi:peroxiredoxin
LRRQQLFNILLPLVFGIMVPSFNISAQSLKGLHPGAKAPAIHLKDERGRQQSLATLSGPNGLLLLFFRSADWCPFCKGQLVDLEGSQKAFAAKGINVAAVSYDSVAILADFAKHRSITYPLLSDTSSSLIDAFGIRNPEGTGMEAGIPYPGYYLIGRDGVIQRRFFETAYVNRLTASNLYSNLFGSFAIPTPSKALDATPHVAISTIQSDAEVTPGAVVRLAVVIKPGLDTHIYAPGRGKAALSRRFPDHPSIRSLHRRRYKLSQGSVDELFGPGADGPGVYRHDAPIYLRSCSGRQEDNSSVCQRP